MASQRQLSQGPMPSQPQRDSDDDFGLSSADEADMLKAEDQTSSQVQLRPTMPRSPMPNTAAGPSYHPAVGWYYPVVADNVRKRRSEENLHNPAKALKIDDGSALTYLAQKALQEKFGLNQFQLKQKQVIDRLLSGGSAVVVFPTGGGKSLCFQVPAVSFKDLDKSNPSRQGGSGSGITLVVSPLIALMKDQVDALKRRGISAASMDSSKTREEYLETVNAIRNGTLDILYCAPERLNNEGFVSSIASVKGGVRLLAVDEAHCISEWGHAFRPDYLKVARFAKEVEAERVVCLTATATPTVAKDICRAFEVPDEGLFRTSTYRPNLRLQARSFQTKTESYPVLQAFLRSHPGPTIIYVTLQRHTEELSERLRDLGFDTLPFHAGMETEAKKDCQDLFMASSSMIIVATIAFGMGIDKPNIRNIIHYDIPASLEGYSQEIGRAGRDGRESHCVLFLCAEDLHLRESFARGDLPSRKSVQELLEEVLSSNLVETRLGPVIEASLYHQSATYDIRANVLSNIYAQLELRFGLLRATTPKYSSYSYVQLRDTIPDKSPAANAVRVHSTKTTKAKWTHIDVDKTAEASGLSRNDIVAKLNDWKDDQLIDLRTSGVVNVFHVMKTLPSTANEQQEIIDQLYADLEAREQQALGRMRAVMDLTTGSACLARTLAQHFGDGLPDGKEACGQCTWCETKQAVKRVTRPIKPWDSNAFSKILEAVPARDDPRFLARVAFGIGSPRVTKEKLAKHHLFGSMEDQNFVMLLDAFTKVCEK